MKRPDFDELALSHLDAVYRFCMHLTRSAGEAADLVQDVYARAFREDVVAAFEPVGGGIKPWLFRIARTTWYMKLERQKTERHAMEQIRAEAGSCEAPSAEAVGRSALHADGEAWEQVDGRLRRAIDELSEEHREVLLLWGVEDLKYREIADVLDVPVGTVMSRLHRARSQIAERILSDGQLADDLRLRPPAQRTHTGVSQ
jgi:RNA polymerase sigma-70 factor, ECF subfamily